jgi:putative hydrolase
MKTWERYREYALNGEWHVHTSYTDGKSSVSEYCEAANKNGLPLIAFTEHVRRNLDYDFGSFLADIEEARTLYDLIILSGCEAKILPNGELDVDEAVIKEVDYPICSFHSFPADPDLYVACLLKVFENYPVNAWGHPGAFLMKYNLRLSPTQLNAIFDALKRYSVALELNCKYNVPIYEWRELARIKGISSVRGSDAHACSDIRPFHDLNSSESTSSKRPQ